MNIGSSGVDGLPMMPKDPYAYVEAALQDPPSPNYVLGPKEPEHAPPSPDFVPEPVSYTQSLCHQRMIDNVDEEDGCVSRVMLVIEEEDEDEDRGAS
ncbi:hypothetical protein Tco_1447935 [Tanacetum coccineum]